MKRADLEPADLVSWALEVPDRCVTIYARDPARHRRAVEALRAAVRRGQAVVFDDDASWRVGEVSLLDGETLLHLSQSARLPWPSALVMVSFAGFSEATGAPVDPAAPSALGLLIERIGDDPAHVRSTTLCLHRSFGSDWTNIPLMLEPVGIEWDFRPGPPKLDRSTPLCEFVRTECTDWVRTSITADAFHAVSVRRDMLDLFVLGRAFLPALRSSDDPGLSAVDQNDDPGLSAVDQNDEAWRIRLGAKARPVSTYSDLMELPDLKHREQFVRGVIGASRIALTVLILLGLSGAVRVEETQPRGRRLVGGRPTPYLAKSRIVIDLAPVHAAAVSASAEGHEAHARRRHVVRGHWCYARKGDGDPACAHTWVPEPAADARWATNVDRQHCACGARRWWRREHERGDAAEGYVHHDNVLVTSH